MKLTKRRLAFKLAGVLVVLLSLYGINSHFGFFKPRSASLLFRYSVEGHWQSMANVIDDYYEESVSENNEIGIDGFIDYYNARFQGSKLSKEPPVDFHSEINSAYYMALPKTLASSNSMLIGYSQELPERRGSELIGGYFRVLLLMRGNGIKAVVVDSFTAESIIGEDIRMGMADFYYEK